MPPVPHIAFVQGSRGLSQRIFSGRATLSGQGEDLCLVVDGEAQRLAYKSAHEDGAGVFEAIAESEDVHVETRLAPGPGCVSVVSRLTALRPLTLSGFEHAYAAHEIRRRERLDDLWLPLLNGKAGRAIGLPAFRAPCIVAQVKDRSAALIPDLDRLEKPRLLPPVLDFERPGTLKLGLAAGRLIGEGHLERRPKEGIFLPDHDVVELSFVILLADGVGTHGGLGMALRFIWSRFGERRLDDLAPQTLPFDDYARYAYDGAFSRYALWRDVFLEAGPAGGVAFRAKRRDHQTPLDAPRKRFDRRVRLHAVMSGALPWRRRRSILKRGADFGNNYVHFTTDANQLRSAYGMAHFARRWGDEKLFDSARAIVRLALAAPTEKGLFPAVYVGTPDRPAWVRGTKGEFLDDRYALQNLCESALWMLDLAEDLGLDEALSGRARDLGETLLALQAENGALPARIRVNALGGVHPSGKVRPQAPTAIAGALFAHLGAIGQDDRFMQAARKAAAFIIDTVMPAHAWRDLGTFFSCRSKPARWRDGKTGLSPQSTPSMAWAVDLFLTLHESGLGDWLEPALCVLDELLLYQQIWNADFLDFDTRGGFGAMNTDARWGDARQALFAPLLMRAYETTGNREYALRAAAALRAAFALMLVPENGEVAPGLTAGLKEEDYGLTAGGFDWNRGGARASSHLSFDWGSGSACAAAAWVQRHYGDLFVDFSGKTAIGLNGCRVVEARISDEAVELRLARLGEANPMHRNPLAPEQARTIVLRARGPSAPKVRLQIDGANIGAIDRRKLLKGIPLPGPRA